MSYHTWHTYGYGVRTDNIKVKSVDALQALIALAPLTEKDFKDWFEENKIENPTLEDYYDYDDTNGCNLAGVLKMVIMETENVELTACCDFNDEDYLIYEPIYPWNLTNVDRVMTKEKLNDIFVKYFSMISDTMLDIGFQEAENGG